MGIGHPITWIYIYIHVLLRAKRQASGLLRAQWSVLGWWESLAGNQKKYSFRLYLCKFTYPFSCCIMTIACVHSVENDHNAWRKTSKHHFYSYTRTILNRSTDTSIRFWWKPIHNPKKKSTRIRLFSSPPLWRILPQDPTAVISHTWNGHSKLYIARVDQVLRPWDTSWTGKQANQRYPHYYLSHFGRIHTCGAGHVVYWLPLGVMGEKCLLQTH